MLRLCSCRAAATARQIKVDQVGYLTGAPKVALVAVARRAAGEFTVRRAGDGVIALRGTLSARRWTIPIPAIACRPRISAN